MMFSYFCINSAGFMKQSPDNIFDDKPTSKAGQGNVLTQVQIELVNEARKKIKDDPDDFVDWKDARTTLTDQ